MSAANLLEVEDLRKVFQVRSALGGWEEFVAVDGVSFVIPRGGSLAVVGESGSGKTTTARLVAGLETRTSGRIVFDGNEWAAPRSLADRRRHASNVQMVFQDPFGSLDPRQSLGACMHEVLELHYPDMNRVHRSERVEELFSLVGLDASHIPKRPRALSGGQRQRFAIGRALAMEPQLLILDEAVSALDVSVQAQILNLLADLRGSIGVSYLFVSHDLAVVRQLCDDVIVMRDGQVVEAGATTDVMDAPQSEYARELLAAIPRPAWASAP